MFHIITGKPGASKTLHAIELVEQMRAEARKARGVERPVYYWNIGDVKLEGWQALGDAETFDRGNEGVEPDKSVVMEWYKLPRDSIIVLDECQKFWHVRPRGQQAPPHVAHLETHRKSGFDIVGISQDPTLIDSHVRKLCGQHTHYRRSYRTEYWHSWTWMEKCVTDVESTSEQSKAQEARGKFPKKYYGTYRSAVVHNVKAQLPWKWIAGAVIGLVVLPFAAYLAMKGWQDREQPEQLTREQLQADLARERQQTVSAVVTHVKAILEANPWDQRLHSRRVEGLEASKPFYDELVRPVSFPKVAGCAKLVIGEKILCTCNSQQGTKLDMPVRQCMDYVERGWFDFTRDDPKEEVAPLSETPGQAVVATVTNDGGPAT